MRFNDLSAVDKAVQQMLCEQELLHFTQFMFQERRGYKWVLNFHQAIICNALMRVFNGEINRLIINIPPRYSKTEIAVVAFIAWCMGKIPDCEFIHASYSKTLAENNLSNTRDLITSEGYQAMFPNTRLDPSSAAKGHWKTTRGGVAYASGNAGTITGFGAGKLGKEGFGGAIIIDDPIKADEAGSKLQRDNVIEFFQNTIESRTNNPHVPIIVIMQRLHEADLSGWLIGGGNGEEWEQICLPVINEAGEPLWPWKHSKEKLAIMEAKNRYVFAGQYMQRPAPLGGGIYKDGWWRYYNPEAMPRIKRIIQTWDTAFKAKETSDYSVCFTIAETDLGFYVIDRYKDKIEFPQLKRIAKSLGALHKPNAVLVEDKASGQSLIQELKADTLLPIIAVGKDIDKVSCANAITPLIESGRVFLPEGAPWIADFLLTMGQFPNGAHDDDSDALAQGLKYLAHGGGSTGMLDYAEQELNDMKRAKNGE